MSRARAGGIRVLFLGDSITDGWRTTGACLWDEHLAPLGAANFGIWGDAAENLRWRLMNGELEGIAPRVTVLLIGTNNIPWAPSPDDAAAAVPETAAEVAQVVAVVRERLPATRLLLLGIFPRGTPADHARAAIRAVNERLRALADGSRVVFLDVGATFLEGDEIPADVMPDGLHLSERGYRRWADALLPTLLQILSLEPAAAPEGGRRGQG